MPEHDHDNDIISYIAMQGVPMSGPKLPNPHGHEFGKPYDDGYATCAKCKCRENTPMAALKCWPAVAGGNGGR